MLEDALLARLQQRGEQIVLALRAVVAHVLRPVIGIIAPFTPGGIVHARRVRGEAQARIDGGAALATVELRHERQEEVAAEGDEGEQQHLRQRDDANQAEPPLLARPHRRVVPVDKASTPSVDHASCGGIQRADQATEHREDHVPEQTAVAHGEVVVVGEKIEPVDEGVHLDRLTLKGLRGAAELPRQLHEHARGHHDGHRAQERAPGERPVPVRRHILEAVQDASHRGIEGGAHARGCPHAHPRSQGMRLLELGEMLHEPIVVLREERGEARPDVHHRTVLAARQRRAHHEDDRDHLAQQRTQRQVPCDVSAVEVRLNPGHARMLRERLPHDDQRGQRDQHEARDHKGQIPKGQRRLLAVGAVDAPHGPVGDFIHCVQQ